MPELMDAAPSRLRVVLLAFSTMLPRASVVPWPANSSRPPPDMVHEPVMMLVRFVRARVALVVIVCAVEVFSWAAISARAVPMWVSFSTKSCPFCRTNAPAVFSNWRFFTWYPSPFRFTVPGSTLAKTAVSAVPGTRLRSQLLASPKETPSPPPSQIKRSGVPAAWIVTLRDAEPELPSVSVSVKVTVRVGVAASVFE